VLQARGESPDAKAALSDLCAAYYEPVFGFIQRNAPDTESARDLTQEFFQRQLAGQGIDTVDPRHGRFRSYLLGAVKHFLSDMH
jgi:RNA polymerase sigma-70 factor (ECF subfamily)